MGIVRVDIGKPGASFLLRNYKKVEVNRHDV